MTESRRSRSGRSSPSSAGAADLAGAGWVTAGAAVMASAMAFTFILGPWRTVVIGDNARRVVSERRAGQSRELWLEE
ncbi:hypothetical protein PSAC2689_110075 [Paraburkholderia sacchari]